METTLCYSTTCFGPETGPDELLHWLELLRATGVELVEISRKHHQLAKRAERIRELDIRVWSVHGTLPTGAITGTEEELRRAVAAEVERMEDCAAFAPCPYVIHYLNRFNDPVYGERFRTAIELLIRANESLGFTLAIETAPYKPQTDERYPDSAEIAAFVRSFANEKVRMTIDLNHSNLNEDIFAVCRNCRGLIANIHVSDNHGEREEHLVPGSGVIPLKAVMRELRDCGYTGPCNLELHLPGVPDQAAIADINRTVRAQLAQ